MLELERPTLLGALHGVAVPPAAEVSPVVGEGEEEGIPLSLHPLPVLVEGVGRVGRVGSPILPPGSP